MGFSESSLSTILKPVDCLAHCKCTAKSPCCNTCHGEDDHCSCGIDTHTYDDDDDNNSIEQVSVISDK